MEQNLPPYEYDLGQCSYVCLYPFIDLTILQNAEVSRENLSDNMID